MVVIALDVQEYVKKNRKTVTTRSGATFVIRKIPPTCMHIVFKLAQYAKSATGEVDPRYFEELSDVLRELIPKCVVEPKITLEPQPDSIALDDLGLDDVMELFTSIFDFTGLGPRQAAERDKFRQNIIS